MWVQKMIWFLGRAIFYMLLLPLLIGLVYTLSHELWPAALVILILCVIVLYVGLIRLRIPANSLVMRDGKVVFFIPEKTVRNRFDFVSRGQTIVELPQFRLLDRPFKLELFFPDSAGGVRSCRLKLYLAYLTELAALQRAYDAYILYQDRLPLEVKKQLFASAAHQTWPFPVQGEEDREAYLQPVVAQLNLGLEKLGMKVEEATCTFSAGPSLVRFVEEEEETVERAAVSGGGT